MLLTRLAFSADRLATVCSTSVSRRENQKCTSISVSIGLQIHNVPNFSQIQWSSILQVILFA